MQNKITVDFVGFGNIVSLYYHHSYEDSFTNLGSVDYDQVGSEYSEKATKFCEIFPLILTTVSTYSQK